MMKKSWQPPEIKAFERLNVRDGLLIDANKWKLEHSYLRKRQNYHYQSLNQAGIVCGLEVGIISPPDNVRPEHRNQRWIALYPGVALDHQGNIIVVPTARKYQIDGNVPPQKTSQTIYLVLRYRDPDDLHGIETQDIVTEQFRLDEKTEPPGVGEVEICRFEILPGEIELKTATNVFDPEPNTLDLRYRQMAQWRSQGSLQVAIYNEPQPQTTGLFMLLKSLKGLYPFLEGSAEIDDTFLTPEESEELLANDLLYLTESQFCHLEPLQMLEIKKYISTGGTIIIDGTMEHSQIAELEGSKQELSQAIAKIANFSVFANRQQELQTELDIINQDLTRKIQPIFDLTQKLGVNLVEWASLPYHHPLKTEPFLFSHPPLINQYQTQIWLGEGIILLLGNLSSAWALNPSLSLSRDSIRNAQEMGVNMLHYAWRRKLLTATQKSSVPMKRRKTETPPPVSPPSSSEINSPPPPSSSQNIKPSASPSTKRKQPKPSDNL
jgi:hypothetical protein